MFVNDKTRAAYETCRKTPIRRGSFILYKLLSKTIQKKKEIEEDCLALTCYLILFYFLRFLCESLRTAVALETYLNF